MSEGRVSRAQREAWARKYHTSVRTIDRWRATGDQCDEPCPLDDPVRLRAWWERRMIHTPPMKVLRAVRTAQRTQAACDSIYAPSDQQAGPEARQHSSPEFAPVDISKFELGKGQDITFLRRRVASLQDQIARDLKAGREDDVLIVKHTKLVKALRERERDDRIDSIQAKRFISREEYQRDAVLAADMAFRMHDSMARRIGELCSFLSAEHRHVVVQAARAVLKKQGEIFQRLGQFNSVEDILAELAA